MKTGIVYLLAGALACPARGQERARAIHAAADVQEIRIEIQPLQRGKATLLEIIDPVSGRCVRTLYAAPAATGAGSSARTASRAPKTRSAVSTDAFRPINPIRHMAGASGPSPPPISMPCS